MLKLKQEELEDDNSDSGSIKSKDSKLELKFLEYDSDGEISFFSFLISRYKRWNKTKRRGG